MSISRHRRTPLGAFYRTPLGAFRNLEPATGTVISQSILPGQGAFGNLCAVGLAAGDGHSRTDIQVVPSPPGLTNLTWFNFKYTGQTSGIVFDPRAESWQVDSCLSQAETSVQESVVQQGAFSKYVVRAACHLSAAIRAFLNHTSK